MTIDATVETKQRVINSTVFIEEIRIHFNGAIRESELVKSILEALQVPQTEPNAAFGKPAPPKLAERLEPLPPLAQATKQHTSWVNGLPKAPPPAKPSSAPSAKSADKPKPAGTPGRPPKPYDGLDPRLPPGERLSYNGEAVWSNVLHDITMKKDQMAGPVSSVTAKAVIDLYFPHLTEGSRKTMTYTHLTWLAIHHHIKAIDASKRPIEYAVVKPYEAKHTSANP